MRMVVNGLSKTSTRQLVEPPSYQYILTQYIISPIIWFSQQVPIWNGKTYQRSFKRVFTMALKANLARHHERLSDANCRNRSNEAHMKDFFEPRLKFPPHIWHRQLGYKIYSFCTHVCIVQVWRLRIGCNLFVWLAPFGKMTICKLASRLAWLLCIQWDIGTMACAMCIVYSGRLVQCDLPCAVCIVNSGAFALVQW